MSNIIALFLIPVVVVVVGLIIEYWIIQPINEKRKGRNNKEVNSSQMTINTAWPSKMQGNKSSIPYLSGISSSGLDLEPLTKADLNEFVFLEDNKKIFSRNGKYQAHHNP